MTANKEDQIALIRRRCADDRFNTVPNVPDHILIQNLRMVIEPREFNDKDVLEIGAGCSVYLRLFLEFGARRLVANDLIDERLKMVRIDDPRCEPLPGDFLEVPMEDNSFDIVFAHLTMMWVVQMHDEFFAKIYRVLKPGGCLVTFDPNYLSPFSIYRRFSDRTFNPTRLFRPFSYKKRAIRHGFHVVKLVPLATNHPWATGNWLVGTSFMMRAEKPQTR